MTFKPLNENDVTNTRTLLHEAIPLTGTILSGTYGTFRSEENIKNYSHGMFQSVYDYPYLSSSANHIFDITTGIATQSPLYSSVSVQKSKKKNIYNQMSQVLMGYDATGSVLQFDEDGDIIGGGSKLNSCFILPFARLLTKDEIKKETFSLELGVSASFYYPMGVRCLITDVSASTQYRVNSPVGEYGILYATASVNEVVSSAKTAEGLFMFDITGSHMHTASFNGNIYMRCGLIFDQAGVAVITGSIFGSMLKADAIQGYTNTATRSKLNFSGSRPFLASAVGIDVVDGIDAAMTGSTIDQMADSFRNRIYNLQYNNTTELNSTVYFCRANHNEFNYSSNPTYLSNSKIRVKTVATDNPVAYITTVGLYNDNNELLATAKLSEPLKKSPSNEFTIRARLDY